MQNKKRRARLLRVQSILLTVVLLVPQVCPDLWVPRLVFARTVSDAASSESKPVSRYMMERGASNNSSEALTATKSAAKPATTPTPTVTPTRASIASSLASTSLEGAKARVPAVNLEHYTIEKMPEMVRSEVVDESGKSVEIAEDGAEVLNAVTIQTENGMNAVHIFPYDVKYVEGNAVKFITNQVVRTPESELSDEEGKQYEYQNVQGEVARKFSTNPETGVRLEYKKHAVDMAPLLSPEKAGGTRAAQKLEAVAVREASKVAEASRGGVAEVQGIPQVDFQKRDEGVTYDRVLTEGTSIQYSSLVNGIKEDVVLAEYEGVYEFHFLIDTHGLVPDTMKAKGTGIALRDAKTDEAEMFIGQVVAFDAGYEEASDVTDHVSFDHELRLEPTGEEDEYVLTIVADKEFLEDEDTSYPVTIDPTITIRPSTLRDTYVNSAYHDANYASAATTMVGYVYAPVGSAHTFVQFDNLKDFSYINPQNVDSVKYKFNKSSSPLSSMAVDVCYVKNAWEYDAITYSNNPGIGTVQRSYVWQGSANEVDVTGFFRSSLSSALGGGGVLDGYNAYGFCMTARHPIASWWSNGSSRDGVAPASLVVNYREDASVVNGGYFIRNKANGRYLDANGSTLAWYFHGGSNQQWVVKSRENGTYVALSMYPPYYGIAIGPQTSDDMTIAGLYPQTSTAKTSLRFIKNQDGSYRITTFSGGPNRALTAENGVCVFRQYNNASNQKWYLEPKYEMTINNYFDRGFGVRYDQAGNPVEKIQEVNKYVNDHLNDVFGLVVNNNAPLGIISLADDCKTKQNLGVNHTTINQLCPGGTNHTPLCTGWAESYPGFIGQYPGNDTTSSILWMGNRLRTVDGNGDILENRSFAWYDSGIIIQEIGENSPKYYDDQLRMLIHEISHQIGAVDHYHEIRSDGTCIGGDSCDDCGRRPRPEDCIMDHDNLGNLKTRESHTIWCQGCRQDIEAHLNLHH